MIGCFLELSLPADPVLTSVQFYERLGFGQAHTADLWSHHYGVISDGRFHLGLHGDRVTVPTLSWVREDVEGLEAELQAAGLQIDGASLDEHRMHELALTDPDGIGVRVLEARSFSPPGHLGGISPLGWFRELRLRVTDLDRSEAFWAQAGMVCCGRGQRPTPRAALSCDGLNLTLVQDADAPPLVAVFEHSDLAGLLLELGRRDLEPTAARRSGDQVTRIDLHSPEGLRIRVEQASA
jgi:predicted lactoylglutathione lyase